MRAVAFFAEHGIDPIRRVLTDNGSCYRSHKWAQALESTGTVHKRTRPYTPRTNGKVERFNKTLGREWAYVREYDSEAARRAALIDFLNEYNHTRPHSSLKGQPPASRVPLQHYRLTSAGIVVPDSIARPEQLSFDDHRVVPAWPERSNAIRRIRVTNLRGQHT